MSQRSATSRADQAQRIRRCAHEHLCFRLLRAWRL